MAEDYEPLPGESSIAYIKRMRHVRGFRRSLASSETISRSASVSESNKDESERVRGQAANAIVVDDAAGGEQFELPPFHKAEDFYQRALATNAVARQIYELAQHHQIEEIPMLRYMVGCLAKLCGTYAELAVEASLRNPAPVSMPTPPNKLKTQHDASDPERDGM